MTSLNQRIAKLEKDDPAGAADRRRELALRFHTNVWKIYGEPGEPEPAVADLDELDAQFETALLTVYGEEVTNEATE